MFGVVFFIFIFIIIFSVTRDVSKTQPNGATSNNFVLNILYKALDNNEFTNKRILSSNSYYKLITADTNGENYIFAISNISTKFNISNIQAIHEIAKNSHIHNVVIINHFSVPYADSIMHSINEFGMEVWDLNKLNTLALRTPTNATLKYSTNELNTPSTPTTKSVLRTSNTSDDKCVIDTDSADPIQDLSNKKLSFFGQLFKKPDRL